MTRVVQLGGSTTASTEAAQTQDQTGNRDGSLSALGLAFVVGVSLCLAATAAAVGFIIVVSKRRDAADLLAQRGEHGDGDTGKDGLALMATRPKSTYEDITRHRIESMPNKPTAPVTDPPPEDSSEHLYGEAGPPVTFGPVAAAAALQAATPEVAVQGSVQIEGLAMNYLVPLGDPHAPHSRHAKFEEADSSAA